MILRSSYYQLLTLFCLLLCSSLSLAADPVPFGCRLKLEDNIEFDLTSLSGEHVLNRTRETPPSTTIDSLRFDLCGELKSVSEIPEHDQCPSGTKACLTKIVTKANTPDLISAVIPIAQSNDLKYIAKASSTPKSLNIILHGAEYPKLGSPSPVQQSLNLTVICVPEGSSDPKFIAYDGATLDVEWNSPAGCPFSDKGGDENKGGDSDDSGDDKPKDEPEKEKDVGSGIGWFFLVLLLAFIAYLGLGAYYNYSTYGASGFDLIP
ncbi:hypothetical protein D9613_000704 [Agrocybe pediades]|uniref:Autophagy-related protein 27 n=1 Tax=Agrocybe pediades TaxID=84607 RepID=A0A8H4R092_9AGAR|nr:hypothetical protein D9613_000704 [Agrocybe pediades]